MTTRSAYLCLVLLVGGMAVAQTVTPPIAEFRGLKAEGSFRIDNSTNQPMLVLLETKSFTVSNEGNAVFGQLPSTIHVDLGSSSFIIRPHDNHTVYYKAISSASPASFSIMPTMTPMSQTKGMRINFCIPHTIYMYQKAKLVKNDVQVAMKEGKVSIINSSQKLGRVQFIQVKGSEDLNGFPLYPGQTREITIAGTKATVQFEEGFKFEVR